MSSTSSNIDMFYTSVSVSSKKYVGKCQKIIIVYLILNSLKCSEI